MQGILLASLITGTATSDAFEVGHDPTCQDVVRILMQEVHMPDEQSGDDKASKSTLARLLGLAAAAAIPPIGAIVTVGVQTISQNVLLAGSVLVLYEFLVAAAGFASGVASGLQDRWTARTVDSLDGALVRRFARYESTYLRYIRASNSFVDLQGLTTRGEYTFSLEEVFVSIAVDPTAPTSLEASLI